MTIIKQTSNLMTLHVEETGSGDPLLDDRPDAGMAKAIVTRYGAENAREMMTSWSTAARELLDTGGDISLGSAQAIRCAVLLIVGEKDAFVPVEDVQTLASRLADATAMIVPDAGHMVHQQRADRFSPRVACVARHDVSRNREEHVTTTAAL